MSFPAKLTALVAVLLCISGVLTFSPAAATLQSLQTGMEAPDFSLGTVTGGTKSFSDVKGEKITILMFWSTWSANSKKELERMQQLQERYKDRGLSIVAVNADGQDMSDATLTDIKTMCGKLHIGFPMLVDQGLVAFHDYGIIAIPSTVILDGQRIIQYELSGYPLVGSEAMIDYITSTFEGEKKAEAPAAAAYLPGKNALRFFNLGKVALKSRDTDEAAAMFQKAIQADPAFVLPHLSLAKIYSRQADAALAQNELQKALDLDPENPIALCELGLILIDGGKTEEGMALFGRAGKSEGAYAPCYYYAGYAYGKENRPEEGLKMFDTAERINPLDYNTFVYKAKFYEERKDLKKAFESYKKALGLILNLTD